MHSAELSTAWQLLAPGDYKACRAGQWPPPDHHPAGGGQQVTCLVLAVDVAFPAAHQPLPCHQGSEDRLRVGGIRPEVHEQQARPGQCTGVHTLQEIAIVSGVKTCTTLASKNAS